DTGADPGRRGTGDRPGDAGAHRLRCGVRPNAERVLHGLCAAARRRSARLRHNIERRADEGQPAWRERRGPGGSDGSAAGDHQCGAGCTGAARRHAYRHAGDTGTSLACHPGGTVTGDFRMTTQTRIAAEDYLEALGAHGIDYLFANPGTDFAPIVEAFARSANSNRKVPQPIVVPHENAAFSMAHGYTMITGKPQAVMLHTNVGTANSINMLINASRDRVPVLLTSGRTPFTESGAEGSRNAHIHWAQEMYDQAGMLREMVKWDYEMKRGDQAASTVDRALDLAMSSPKGPVYLSLPREVLGETVDTPRESNLARRARPRAPTAAPADIEQLADWIAEARAPMIITGLLGQDPRDAVVLARLAENWALPVVPYNARYFAIASNHPMFQGSMPGPLLESADLVIAIEADVPWLPSRQQPLPGARIVQIGEDPLFSRYPMRSFPSDLTIRATALSALEALEQALLGRKG